MKTRFSILIPAYNREKYVRQAIDSVLSQAFTDYELFVIDDGSTDKTLQVLQSYGTRIKVLRQANQGPEVARNKAAALARGEYLVLLDSDDILLPGALSIYDQAIRAFDSPPLIIGAMTDFQDGQSIPAASQASLPIKVLKYHDYLSKDVALRLSSSRIVLRKSVFDEVGGLRNTTAATFHLDSLNLILKVATYEPCIVVQQPCTVAYRHHETNAIRSLEPIADGILVLARSEHQGQYPGGSRRRRDRYACIGGVALSWAVGHCLRAGSWKLALRLLRGTAPMGLAAVWKKVLTRLRQPTQTIVLSKHQSQSTARNSLTCA
jgi:glycosyltransferase involved in cell wall biosynthesis